MAGLSTLFRFVSFEELKQICIVRIINSINILHSSFVLFVSLSKPKQMGIIRIVSFINIINSTITSFSLVGYKVASFMIL